MNKEIKYFLLWLLIKENLIKTIKWFVLKIYYKFIYKNYSYKYPDEIYSSLKKLDKPNYINGSKSITKYPSKLNKINKIKLASRNLEITSYKVDWLKDFRDSEDTESIHRWNWMIHGISKKNNQITLEELTFYQRDWNNKFINEIEYDASKYLRWSSYSVAERISNSIIIFNYFNKEIPPDIINNLNQQVHYLSKNLEYFERSTGNHIINNARAMYMFSTYLGDSKIQKFAKKIFYDQLHRVITKDGFLREGSSHYHFLFLRWLLEVLYFSNKFKDDSFSQYLKTYIFNLTKNSNHFLYKNSDEILSISLFGDISPDFEPEWLASLIHSNIIPFKINSFSKYNLPTYSWNNLWDNDEKTNIFSDQLIDIKLNNINHLYPRSGWYFLNNFKTKILIRADKKSIQNNVGHYNQDLFHINISLNETPFLISLGRLNYNFSDNLGQKGIFSKSHNSFSINNLSYLPNKVNYFPIEYCQSENNITHNENYNELTITSNCFKRINNSIIVSRKITLNDEYINIQDIVEGSGEYLITRFFYFHHKFTLNSNKIINTTKRVLEFINNESIFYFEIHGEDIKDIKISILDKNKEVYSYGKYHECIGIKLENSKKLPSFFNIKIR